MRERSYNELHPDKENLLLLQNVSSLCFTKLQDESFITIFEVNRWKYIEQNYEDKVLLWMVVSITISGVILAGLQLFASYKLAVGGKAEFAKDSDVTLAKDRLSVKSSVTGLLILAMSLGFFIVYVKYVYEIDNTNVSSAAPIQPFAPAVGGQHLPIPVKATVGATAQPSSDTTTPIQPPATVPADH